MAQQQQQLGQQQQLVQQQQRINITPGKRSMSPALYPSSNLNQNNAKTNRSEYNEYNEYYGNGNAGGGPNSNYKASYLVNSNGQVVKKELFASVGGNPSGGNGYYGQFTQNSQHTANFERHGNSSGRGT